ncbi:TRAP transporter small permease [Halomonas organivorans]|uniref:TRAP transporter small permease protein n=1 Tax=Halomonas organivorans TaxID=257772 RepID=A0A7W5BUY7_9GAMM|nr:TRAP transporter small permease [Halomonas organivorans]MBB3139601.1 TRAP-type C4-dicarboxylate transport system permease small subunit [Halomonas organivorans]
MYRCNLLISRVLLLGAGLALLAIVALVAINIVMRQVTSSFGGTTEVVGWLTAVVVAFSLAHAQLNKAHVELDILVARFPVRFQAVLQALVASVSLLFFSMVAIKLWEYGYGAMQRGMTSQTLRLLLYPMIYLVALGFSAFCLALLMDVFDSLKRVVMK